MPTAIYLIFFCFAFGEMVWRKSLQHIPKIIHHWFQRYNSQQPTDFRTGSWQHLGAAALVLIDLVRAQMTHFGRVLFLKFDHRRQFAAMNFVHSVAREWEETV